MNNQFLHQYLQNNFGKVEGFCPPTALHVLDHIDTFINSPAKSVLEIGVHHGQFFIALNQLATSTSYAVDIFDHQYLNIDKSGNGNLQKFIENLETFDVRHKGSNVIVIENDSLDYKSFESVKNCHYISVDGGHTPEHVVSDLSISAKVLAPGGVIIVDDFFNHWWPSVTEGIAKYLLTTPSVVPFCTSHNKIWLCSISYRDLYIAHMRNIPSFSKTETSFFGHKIIDLW